MYPWLKMLLHCKNKITDIFPYFFKENTVKYFNTFQKKRDEKIEKVENSFFDTHCILLPWWNAEKQLKFSSWGSKAAEHTLCLKISWESQAPRAFFQPGAGFKVSWYHICAAAAIFAPPPLSCNFHNDDKPEQKWSTVIWKNKTKKLHVVQSFSDDGFCCIIGLSGLQIDWPMNLGSWLQVFFRF